ncbi:hypothetical protein ACHBTE_26055 [Streptomyces sp. M41]|uniref:hypothetical protein n=1 Tax=Streptomyces sp. M41 TaxID=3059412 RepID=UPI00374D36B0
MTTAEHAGAVFRRTLAVGGELRTALTARLRPCQVGGVSWLRETIDTHSGAVPADEMGLGKTLQLPRSSRLLHGGPVTQPARAGEERWVCAGRVRTLTTC